MICVKNDICAFLIFVIVKRFLNFICRTKDRSGQIITTITLSGKHCNIPSIYVFLFVEMLFNIFISFWRKTPTERNISSLVRTFAKTRKYHRLPIIIFPLPKSSSISKIWNTLDLEMLSKEFCLRRDGISSLEQTRTRQRSRYSNVPSHCAQK